MRDFHVRSLRQPIHPVAFGLQSGRVSFVLATMRPERMAETLKYIEDTWKGFMPERPFSCTYLADDWSQP